MTIKQLQCEAHKTAVSKGWWEGDRPVSEILLLINEEVLEAWEDYRKRGEVLKVSIKDGKPRGLPSEMADICIRVFDCCEAWGIDLEAEIRDKMAYNKTRSYRHGEKHA